MDAGRDTLTVSPSQMRFNPTDADDLSQTHNVTRNDQHDSSHGEHARSLSHNAAFSFKAPLRPPDPLRTWQSLNVSTPVPDNLRRDSMHPKFEGNTGWEGNARLDEDIGLEGVAGMEGVTRLDGVARSDRATGLEPGTGLEASSSTTPPTGRRRRSEYAEPGSARAIYLEKNRKAASKCRSKQKMEQEALVEKAREADRRNRLLKQEVELLQGELRNLKELVGQHSDCADNRLQQWVQGEADRLASAGYRPEYRFNAGLGRSTSSTTHVPPRQPY
ncbi:hypothetical protein EJ02DRAFT_469759 [Clathrospora elynae]|uniref:BZIP domain-containing protein n=1 Tax=Clathrospora elynae TaxID=706981 RepID=A0A6A5SCP0_9PLEO|nr:hypothetical protein EJ02DRAFT_469759 [Clathrospora elynae]